jgi:hypothetical protein
MIQIYIPGSSSRDGAEEDEEETGAKQLEAPSDGDDVSPLPSMNLTTDGGSEDSLSHPRSPPPPYTAYPQHVGSNRKWGTLLILSAISLSVLFVAYKLKK